jgi:hypothetical protein
MSSAPFDSTPEFKNFKNVMRKVIAVPKHELDELVKASKNPRVATAPRKRIKKRK